MQTVHVNQLRKECRGWVRYRKRCTKATAKKAAAKKKATAAKKTARKAASGARKRKSA